ncbi:MAG: transposase [Chitinophagales bacterium]|nr:transposase [Chitinophagales bacterium]
MSTGYKILDQNALFYLTFQIVDWVDIFTRKIYKDIVIESFSYCMEHKGLNLYAYVIMSNHIHLIASAREGFALSDIIRDFKKYTAKQFLEEINKPTESRNDWMLKRFEFAAKRHKRNSEFQIWTHENHAVELVSNKFIDQKLNYIHENPVRAGIVYKAEDYMYSSASNYILGEGIINLKILE